MVKVGKTAFSLTGLPSRSMVSFKLRISVEAARSVLKPFLDIENRDDSLPVIALIAILKHAAGFDAVMLSPVKSGCNLSSSTNSLDMETVARKNLRQRKVARPCLRLCFLRIKQIGMRTYINDYL